MTELTILVVIIIKLALHNIQKPFRGIHRRNKRLFISFIMSYLVILLIPVIGALSIYFSFHNQLRAELLRTNETVLTHSMDLVENILDSTHNYCLDLAVNESVRPLFYMTQPFSTNERYNISRALKAAFYSSGINKYIDSQMIYFNRGDFILSSTAYMKPADAYSRYLSSSYPIYEEWYGSLSAATPVNFHNSENTITYFQTAAYSGAEPIATAIINFNKKEILNSVLTLDWIKNGNLFILDNSGELILTNSDAEILQEIPLASILETNTSVTHRHNKNNYLVSQSISDEYGWKYILVTSEKALTSSRQNINKVFLIYSIMALFSGVLLTLLFSRRNYRPIKSMVTLLSTKDTADKDIDEISFIDASVRQIISTNSDYEYKLSMQSELIRQNLLSRIFRRRIGVEGLMPDTLKASGLSFPHQLYQVALFRLDDFEGFFMDIDDSPEEYPLDHIDYSLISLLWEQLNISFTGYVCEIYGAIACVINFSEGQEKEVFDMLRDSHRIIEAQLYIKATVAVSLVHNTAVNLPIAYEEASFALDNSSASQKDIAVFSSDTEYEKLFLTKDLEHALSTSILSGNYSNAKTILSSLFHGTSDEKPIAPGLFRCLVYSVMTTFFRITESLNISENEPIFELMNPANPLPKLTTAQEAEEYFTGLAQKICERQESEKESRNSVLLKDIQTYINTHYTDTNLSNASIASEMGISSAYLSRFFKQQTGEGVLNYTLQVRIEAAKKIMGEQKNITVSEVSRMVGFESTATFIRGFKKQESITPGRYQEIMFSDKYI